MAIMATEQPPTLNFASEKVQPPPQLPDTATLSEKPATNGDAPHLKSLLDETKTANEAAVTMNGMSNGTAATEEVASTKAVAAEDESAAPVEHVESGISGVAAFLPSTNDVVPPTTEPPASMTEPAPVEPTTSDARDEPLVQLPIDPAQAVVDAEGPLAGEPTQAEAAREVSAEAEADKMEDVQQEVQKDAEMTGTTQGDYLLNQPDVPMESTEPQVEPASSALPGSGAPAEPTTSQQEHATTGQVRPREEDEMDVEPAPKRAKTGSAEQSPVTDAKMETPVADTSAEEAATAAGSTDNAAEAPTSLAAQTATQSSSPKPSNLSSEPMTATQNKFLLEQIRKAKKTKSALAYLVPVDWRALNIPTYPDIIKHPMDLKTIEEKLKTNQYTTPNAMMDDFGQMVHNSVLFNGANHQVAQAGQSLRAYFIKCVSVMPKGEAAQVSDKPKKQEPAPPKPARPVRDVRPPPPLAKSPSETKPVGFVDSYGTPLIRRDSSAHNDRPKREIHPPKRELPHHSQRPKKKKAQVELKFCEHVVAELHKKKHYTFAYAFLSPVDPVALNIPNYLKVIKRPMDFGTIQKNLKDGVYGSAAECYKDCKLVFANCYKFNPEGDNVWSWGKQLEKVFDEEWDKKDEWMANNLPPSEPPSEDEEEEEDEPEEEEDPNLKRMQEIQAQIAALSAEALQLTNAQRRQSPKAAPTKTKTKKSSKPPKPSVSSHAAPKTKKEKKAPKPKKLTLEQKREVSEGIGILDESKMRKAVQIIRNGVPALANVQDDELELDIDEIPEDVVYKLWEFVRSSLPKKEREPSPEYYEDPEDQDEYVGRASGGGNGGGRRKNKPMKAQEQEERIEALQRKLAGNTAGSGGGDASMKEESEDEDAASDSEESEEE